MKRALVFMFRWLSPLVLINKTGDWEHPPPVILRDSASRFLRMRVKKKSPHGEGENPSKMGFRVSNHKGRMNVIKHGTL